MRIHVKEVKTKIQNMFTNFLIFNSNLFKNNFGATSSVTT